MKLNLIIGWLYPELMSTYGDRGNIIVLEKRCRWRGIKTEVLNLNEGFDAVLLKKADILFMGGAQDIQQKIVARDLNTKKVKILKEKIKNNTPGLYICGAFQFLGRYYKNAEGKIIKGLSIFDLYTENPGADHRRLIGNIAIKTKDNMLVIGFENHGGRTFLGKNVKPFGYVLKGCGNNGKDKTEGAIYKNSIGTYLHGPILPKNPKIADWIIKKALEEKYKKEIKLEKIDDSLSQTTRKYVLKQIIGL